MNNGIQVSYPRTIYLKVNEACKECIETKIIDFMNYAKEPIQENFTYTLDVSYDDYSYNDYLSFVFYTSMYLGGAHPDNDIVTIVYDIKKNKLVTIKDLVEEKPDLLQILSKESREILKKNDKILDNDMLLSGTEANYDNFSNFAFTPMGLMLFFKNYQVAPYAAGSFKIIIPYECFSN